MKARHKASLLTATRKLENIFSDFFFEAIQARKMSFTIFQNEKTSFQAIKTRSSKIRIIDIFPKGLTHGFGLRMAIFSNFFLGNIDHKNVFCDILERKNDFLGYKNNKFKKSKNTHFSKGVNPRFWSKNGHFSDVFVLDKLRQENIFYDSLKRKNAFLRCKKNKFKRSKY